MEHLAVPILVVLVSGLIMWIVTTGRAEYRTDLRNVQTDMTDRIHKLRTEAQTLVTDLLSEVLKLAKDVGRLEARAEIDELIDKKIKNRDRQ